MEKFPVYSDSGREYLIDTINYEDIICVSAYIRRDGWLGWISKWKKVAGGYFGGRYSPREWNYDIKAMAKHLINEYERRHLDQMIHKEKMESMFVDFEKWDGR